MPKELQGLLYIWEMCGKKVEIIKKDIKIIYGVELSTERNGESVHILGYFKEPLVDSPLLIALFHLFLKRLILFVYLGFCIWYCDKH
mgnify:CR=1 FL=1